MRIEAATFLGTTLRAKVQAGTGQEMVVAEAKDIKEHILQTLLSDPGQIQHNGEGEPQSTQIQTPLGLGARAGPGEQEGALPPHREGQISNPETMNQSQGKCQQSLQISSLG